MDWADKASHTQPQLWMGCMLPSKAEALRISFWGKDFSFYSARKHQPYRIAADYY